MSVAYQQRDRIAELTLDDGKVNAMSLPFFEALNAALDHVLADAPAAVVITGRPGVFSAGLNLKLLPTLSPGDLRTTLVAFGRTMLRVFTFPIPTVAAITGHAIAGGAMLAFACDLRWMAEGAFRLHLNESAIGLTLPTWAITVAESAIPPRWRTEAILHARAYTPDEAHAHAMIHGVARPAAALGDAARAATEPLLGLDQKAYGASKARQRARVVEWALARLEAEIDSLPTRATRA